MKKEILDQIFDLSSQIERLVRENQPSFSCDYFEQKAVLEMYLAVFAFMHHITLKRNLSSLGVSNETL